MILFLAAKDLPLFVTTLLAIKLHFSQALLTPWNEFKVEKNITFSTYFLKVYFSSASTAPQKDDLIVAQFRASVCQCSILRRATTGPSLPLPHVTCHVSPITCHMSPVTCHMPPVTFHLSPVTCHLSPVTKPTAGMKN